MKMKKMKMKMKMKTKKRRKTEIHNSLRLPFALFHTVPGRPKYYTRLLLP